MDPQYLGDGVYAQLDQWGRIVLTTGSHHQHEADNIIVLEPEVLREFDRWREKVESK